MTEPTNVTETVTPVPESDQVSTTEVQNTQEVFDAERAKALINKLRDEVKELKPKAKKADEFELAEKSRKEAEMTELQKAQARIDELTAQTKAADLRELRRKVGEAAKLPPAIYELLPEMEEEAMKAKAEELAKAIPQSKQSPTLNPTNPSGNAQETEEQKRARLFGNYQDIFKGGGVNFPTQE